MLRLRLRSSLLLVLSALAAPVLGGCGAGGLIDSLGSQFGGSEGLPGAGNTAAMSPAEDAYAREVLRLVNVERGNVGAPPVAWDDSLASVAYGHSVDMDARNFFSHTNPSGQGPSERLAAAGVTGLRMWGENIAYGQSDPADVMNAWMNSTGHRNNILNPSFTLLGVGVHGPGTIWWTQVFGAR
jgi:uncharacterized protein YkwD